MTGIIIFGFVMLAAAAIIWPRHGLWSRWREARRLAARARREDALKHILKCEANGEHASVLSVAGALRVRDNAAAALLSNLEAGGLISFEEGRLRQDVYYEGAYHDAVVMAVLRDEFDAARAARDGVAADAR
ncbi:MAG: hypothetical protein WD941_04655 [Opitutus sp.]